MAEKNTINDIPNSTGCELLVVLTGITAFQFERGSASRVMGLVSTI